MRLKAEDPVWTHPDGVQWSSLEVQSGVTLGSLELSFRNASAAPGALLVQPAPGSDASLAASLAALLAPYPTDAPNAPAAAAPEQATVQAPVVLPLRLGQGAAAVSQGDERPVGQVSAASLQQAAPQQQLGRKLLDGSTLVASQGSGREAAQDGGEMSGGREGSEAVGQAARPLLHWVRLEQQSLVVPAMGSATQQLTFTGALLCACVRGIEHVGHT
jgi:hypothetical protein